LPRHHLRQIPAAAHGHIDRPRHGPRADRPADFGRLLKFSLTGDLLTEDGQLDKAQVMYGRAELSLVKETEKFTFQQKQTRRWTASVSQY
jgi:hypothetical protein